VFLVGVKCPGFWRGTGGLRDDVIMGTYQYLGVCSIHARYPATFLFVVKEFLVAFVGVLYHSLTVMLLENDNNEV